MAAVELLRVPLGQDVSLHVAGLLRHACQAAEPFAAAPAVYLASHERRARLVSRLAGESYPEGTPDRVARQLLASFAPQVQLRGEIERDFDLFAAVEAALRERGENRRVGRAIVDEALAARKRLAQAQHPDAREAAEWQQPLGERGALLASVDRHYDLRLKQAGAADPEDALWLAADLMGDWPLAPGLVVVDDLDRITPARAAFIERLFDAAARVLVIVRGSRDTLPLLAQPHEFLQECVLRREGRVVPPTGLPARPLGGLAEAWLADAPLTEARLKILRPPTRTGEVREAARAIKRAALEGVALADICVAMPATGAYRELIEQEFAAAGVPYDAPFEIPLDEVAPVAALFNLLRAAAGGLDRTELLDALASPFLRFTCAEESARAAVLGVMRAATREAWVVGGRDAQRDWIGRLQGRDKWPAIRGYLESVLGALGAFVRNSIRAADYMAAVEDLVVQSGAAAVASDDRRDGRPGAGLREAALHALRLLLRQMRAEFLRAGNPVLPATTLLRALTEQANARAVRRPESAADRVRVLGLRELRGVHFRRVICMGLADTDLPLAAEETLFLPAAREEAVAAAVGKPLARELCAPIDLAAQADHLFAHLLLSADESLTLSLPAAEGETPCVPSSQLARLLRSAGVENLGDLRGSEGGEAPVSRHELAAGVSRGLCAVERGQGAGPALALTDAGLRTGLAGRGIELARTDTASPPGPHEGLVGALPALAAHFDRRHLFSPSQLDNYAECPMRFWARYVVRARATEEPTLDTRPNAIGTLLHATFERWILLLREHAGQPAVLRQPIEREPVLLCKLAPDDSGARELGLRLMSQAFDSACADTPTEGPFWEGVKQLVRAGLPGTEPGLGTGLLARFVDYELQRSRAGVGARFVEFRFGRAEDVPEPGRPDTTPDPIELEIPGGGVMLLGSIDRVDDGPEGLEIIDYKTGGARTTAEVRDGRAFQLPVYLAAVSRLTGRAPHGMSYLRVLPEGVIKPVDVTRARGKPAYDVGALVHEHLPRRLGKILAGLQAGVFMHLPFGGSGDPCAWCDYASACARRGDVMDARQARLQADGPREVAHVYLPDTEAQ